ncbi:hypothetical protein HYPSUDRAFT_172463 [Hypholoma sublateritium FD-334 SS-4]|uniref:NAD-dependent epimerase/dehydratase domain-containing protein n=1 Tax=Hypholoma sublateritium (strain FD-334 SS-4) TaxID=945553 RepID=A0A0D2NFP8_HYPSF|nr:hypothetical protein HYPSUDRAFT_172463 [Hypholoma sublateritium FD-334 SS-4]
MPALIPSPDKVILVTGANGYIAMWIVKVLLEKGFSVRGAVRSQQKAELLSDYFADKMYGDRVKWVIVPNIQTADAFDEAVKGVDGIIHTASPLPEASTIPDDLIKPAVEGTVNILNSAMKYSTQITRIVITSSGAAIIGKLGEGTTTFNETHWGDESVKIVEEQGMNAPPMVKYRASKTLAEKAAWQFYSTHKTDLSFDLVTINPPIVVGVTAA